MKITQKFICFTFILSFLACGGDSTPQVGTGPGFPQGMTAKELFELVSLDIYLPDPLEGDEVFLNGTANCVDGGKVKVETSATTHNQNSTILYTDCESQFGSSNVALKQNGNVEYYITANNIDQLKQATLYCKDKLSFSGDIGFAADCEFTVTLNSAGTEVIDIDGSCTYTDSEGNELSLNGTEMLEVL